MTKMVFVHDSKTGKFLGLRKRAPIQLCPSPRCRKPAAPVFGMLCAKHKDSKKTDVRLWRAARREMKKFNDRKARKAGGK